jgi:hypothetical protein
MGISGTATNRTSKIESKKPHIIRRLYDWVLHWAHTPYGTPALAILATAESSFFPIPPDPLLMALAMSRPERSIWYALVCSACSVIGGAIGYLIGWQLWSVLSDFFFNHVPGFTHEVFNLVANKYNENAFLAIYDCRRRFSDQLFGFYGCICNRQIDAILSRCGLDLEIRRQHQGNN